MVRLYIKAKKDKLYSISYLIEREDELAKFRGFLKHLPEMKRGVLRIAGLSGSGRTCFLNAIECIALQYNYDVITLLTNPCLKTEENIELMPDMDKTRLNISNISHQYTESILNERLLSNKKTGLILLADDIGKFDFESINLICRILNNKRYTNIALVYTNEHKAVKEIDYSCVPLYETINLSPLSPQGLRLWMNNIYGWNPPDHFLEWFYNETMGLPSLMKSGIQCLMGNDILVNDAKSGFVIKDEYININLSNGSKSKSFIAKNNLPSALTEFVGRSTEIEKINHCLQLKRVTLHVHRCIEQGFALCDLLHDLYNYIDVIFSFHFLLLQRFCNSLVTWLLPSSIRYN